MEGKRPRDRSPIRAAAQGYPESTVTGARPRLDNANSLAENLSRRAREPRRADGLQTERRRSRQAGGEQVPRQDNLVSDARSEGNNTTAEIVRSFNRVVQAAMADESRGSTTRMPAGSSNTSSSTSTTTSSTLQGPTNSTPRGTPCGSDSCQR